MFRDDERPTSLIKQLELTRFERAIAVADSIATNRALLTTMEMERLNNMITGRTEDPWRTEPVDIKLPGGKLESLHILKDPKMGLREHLHRATEFAENGKVIDAAVEVYAGLVMEHVFKDGNRRTAVVAAHYFLARYGVPLSGLALHEIGLGDLREPGHREALKETIAQMAKFASRRK